ncbi:MULTISPECIES: DUF7226 domain-containing protein [Nostocales]|uniref:DUF7226 domain-containing protein n=3 Tax=Nostocales TaxID=1161 RepID=A0A8S9T7D4_9CYAN|nr:hypothetical protein [Tolypothrix bouteillei]KAF3887978.1 hypothetical protein DA73_0400022645 [Tolypothrix bouteillei VB521301]
MLHFLRINFFLDPPEQLPYTVEFEFLTSGLCHEIDTDLYEIEPEIRDVLLQGLMRRENAPERIRDIATLLWQYIEEYSPWVDRIELEQAQKLTALNFLNPDKAKQWLDNSQANASKVGLEREWFIAMREEIQHISNISTSLLFSTKNVSSQLHDNYIYHSEKIQPKDVITIFEQITIIPDPINVPFPQADKFERIIDLLWLLAVKDLAEEDITKHYQFNVRQTRYYTSAGRYLGLINKFSDISNNKLMFSLTNEGKYIVYESKTKCLDLVKVILKHKIFYKVFGSTLNLGMIPSNEVIIQLMSTSDLNMSDNTIRRRASTVRGWTDWIWSSIDWSKDSSYSNIM